MYAKQFLLLAIVCIAAIANIFTADSKRSKEFIAQVIVSSMFLLYGIVLFML